MDTECLGYFLDMYRRFAEAENKSPRTIEAVTTSVGRFIEFLGGSIDVTAVKAEDLRSYIRHLQESTRWEGHPTISQNHGKLSSHSIASYVRSIRSFWSWLKREEFISENPLASVPVPKVSHKIMPFPSNSQVTELLQVIPRHSSSDYMMLAMIVTIYGTGLRSSETRNLKLGDVNKDSGQITVIGKGNKQRHVFASPRVFKVLIKYIEKWRPEVSKEGIFIHTDGRQISRFDFAHRLQRYAVAAGIASSVCTPHALRRAFAVEFLRNGGDVFTLQKILGHSTLDMTRRYAELADRDVEEKLKACSPVEYLNINRLSKKSPCDHNHVAR